MLDSQGFDLWADGYDKSVGLSDEENSYPFAGYRKVLGSIFDAVMRKQSAAPKVLDIGFGTGTFTAKLYEKGCTVFGQDFSPRMVGLASAKMPRAKLFCGDFSKGLAEPLTRERYDFIVATYSLHHLDDEQKVRLLKTLRGLLNDGGSILIGDVAFSTRAELEKCRAEAGEGWDDDEIYFVADELKKAFPDLKFEKASFCAGVITIGGR